MLLALSLIVLAGTQEIDTTLAVRQGQRLEVSAPAGEITVHAWPRSEVRIQASATGGARVEIDVLPTALSVRTAARRDQGGRVSYRITVPPWMPLGLSGVNTRIDVAGVEGPVSAETVNGDMTLKGGSGVVSLRSVQGDVSLEGAKGRIDASSVNSDVTVRDVSGDIQVQTVSGALTLERVQSGNVDANTVNGDVSYAGAIRPDGRYRLVTHSGDLTVAVPDGTDALVTVSTFQGDFASDFPLSFRERRGRRMELTLGRGTARVELESFQGTIQLRRAGSAKPRSSESP